MNFYKSFKNKVTDKHLTNQIFMYKSREWHYITHNG